MRSYSISTTGGAAPVMRHVRCVRTHGSPSFRILSGWVWVPCHSHQVPSRWPHLVLVQCLRLRMEKS
jgi:hypothetical protein